MKKQLLWFAFALLGFTVQAQETLSATGGNATGAGGSSSYTIGQPFYSTNTGSDISVAQGVQQIYEVSTTVGINETTIDLDVTIYPNPTSDDLTLATEDTEGLTFELFDLKGKIIESKTINSSSTNISLKDQPSDTYFLRVIKDNQTEKTYKIIKTR